MPLYSTSLRSTPFHSFPLLSTPFHSFPLDSIPLHPTPLHSTSLHSARIHSSWPLQCPCNYAFCDVIIIRYLVKLGLILTQLHIDMQFIVAYYIGTLQSCRSEHTGTGSPPATTSDSSSSGRESRLATAALRSRRDIFAVLQLSPRCREWTGLAFCHLVQSKTTAHTPAIALLQKHHTQFLAFPSAGCQFDNRGTHRP